MAYFANGGFATQMGKMSVCSVTSQVDANKVDSRLPLIELSTQGSGAGSSVMMGSDIHFTMLVDLTIIINDARISFIIKRANVCAGRLT
jgi:hypothetical protein